MNNEVLKTEVTGLRITRLGKTYNRYPFGIKSRRDVDALKEARFFKNVFTYVISIIHTITQKIYLEVEDGELLGILGHNGAGITFYLCIYNKVLMFC